MSTLNQAAAAAATTIEPPAALKGFHAVKDMFREEHPMSRRPLAQLPHPAAWKVYRTRVGRAAPFYTIGLALFFGWPFALKTLVNYNNGVYDKPTKTRR